MGSTSIFRTARAVYAFVALSAFLSVAAPAAAQTAEAVPLPSTIKVIDENGVDLMGGLFHWPAFDESIGTSESGMHIVRQAVSEFDPDIDGNYTARIEYHYVTQYQNYFNHQSYIEVKYQDDINRFTLSNGAWLPYKGARGTFACSGNLCTYTSVQGAVIEFPTDGAPDVDGKRFYAAKVTKPDGEVVTFTYNANGRAISSSLGWMIKFAPGGYRMINSAADYCDPAAANCDTLTAYPVFNLFTDSMGNSWSTITVGTETGQGCTASVSKLTDPRGVETVWAQCPTQDGTGGNLLAKYSNRVMRVTRAGQTWKYTVNYTQSPCCDFTAPFYPWRLNVDTPDGSGRLLEFSPEESQATLYVDEGGHVTTQTYLNNVVDSVTAPGGVKTSYVRDSRQNILSATIRPMNGASDGSEDVLAMTAAYPGSCTNIKTCNKPTSVTDPRGNITSYSYDPNHGGVLTETKPAVNGVQAQTRYTYQQFTPYLASSAGGALAQSPVWRLVSTSTCRTMTLATCVGTADELKTTYSYDPTSSAFGARNLLPLSKTVSLGDGSVAMTTAYTYDRYGNVIVEDGPLPGTDDTVYNFYDLKRRKTGSIGADPDGAGPLPRAAVRTVYGVDGQVESVAKGTVTQTTLAALQAMTPAERVETEYSNVTGLPMVERHYDSGTTPVQLKQMSYDVRNRLECVAVRMNPAAFGALPASACTLGTQGAFGPDRITKYVYDHAGQVLQVRKGVGASSEVAQATYSYTQAGKKDYVIDGNGNRAEFTYDRFNRLKQWIFPSATRPSAYDDSTQAQALATAGSLNSADYEQYEYDLNNNRTRLKKRDGRWIRFSYDALNRVTSKCVTTGASCVAPDAITGRDVYYDYDLLGHQTSARFDSASGAEGVFSTYNALGWLSSSQTVMGAFNKTLTAQYDCIGRRIKLTHPDNQAFSYTYDMLGRLAGIYEGAGTAGSSCTWTPPAVALDTFTYNADGTLNKRTEGTANQSTSTYVYDSIGRLISQTDAFPIAPSSNVTWNFSPTDSPINPASQITREVRDNDAYAFSGIVAVNRTYSVNGLNQYGSAGPASFTYDVNGNLISDGTNAYVYDAENRLVTATASGVTTTLTYDPLGRLFQVVKGAANTRFLYDGDALNAEFDTAGNVTNRYVHGTNAAADDPFAWYVGTGLTNKRYLHADRLGSIVAVTNCSGASPCLNKYDEYGVPQTDVSNNNTNSGRFQYTGQAFIPELGAGMYYYKARMYSAFLGRFLQTDPIGYKDQVNLYAYVGDDPIDGADPDGTCQRGLQGVNMHCLVTHTTHGDLRNREAIDAQSAYSVNKHAMAGSGSKRYADFADVSIADLGASLRKLAGQKGSNLNTKIQRALETGKPQSITMTGVRAGGDTFGNTPINQQGAIGRFSVTIRGTVSYDAEAHRAVLAASVVGEPDVQDYVASNRNPVGEALTAFGGGVQDLAGGHNYTILFEGSQDIYAWFPDK